MDDALFLVKLLQLHLLAVYGLGHAVDALVLAVQDELNELSARTRQRLFLLVDVVGWGREVVPQVGQHAVAYAAHIHLACFQNPRVVVAQSEELLLQLVAIGVLQLHVVVTLVLAATVGDAAAPFGLHVQQSRRGFVVLVHADGSIRVVVVEPTVHLDDGQRGEGQPSRLLLAVGIGHAQGVFAPTRDILEGVVAVGLHRRVLNAQFRASLLLLVAYLGRQRLVETAQRQRTHIEP